MYERILVPTDGSAAAEKAIDGALALAKRFDASTRSIHVVEREQFPRHIASDASAELTRQGETIVGAVADRAAESGVTSSAP